MSTPERSIPRHAENEPPGRDLTRPIYARSAKLDRPRSVAPGPWIEKRPPHDATVLIQGDLSQWQHKDGRPVEWTVGDGFIEVVPGTGDIYTKARFGDVQLHVEFASPSEVTSTGQDRGNSGVFFMGGRYEVQILDNYDNETYPQGYVAGVYGQAAPTVNASRPPGEWQTLDINFRRPRFAGEEVIEPARMTVVHNEILVVDDFALTGPTGQYDEQYSPHEDALPISLQDHNHLVRFRDGGTWVRRLE